MHSKRTALLVLALGLLAGCRTGYNYLGVEGPRYSGRPHVQNVRADSTAGALRIVTFNIKYARQIDSATAVLAHDAALQNADVILLQEMDQDGTQRIANALGLSYVYYPAVFHLKNHRDFGNAILTRWPIVGDEKIPLPHVARFTRTQRAATAATISVRDTLVRVYSVHLATYGEVTPGARRDQLKSVLADAMPYDRVVIGGDMNSHGVGKVAHAAGYTWITEHGPKTTIIGRLDHIFLKGLSTPDSAATGIVQQNHHASDHKPIWAVGFLSAASASTGQR